MKTLMTAGIMLAIIGSPFVLSGCGTPPPRVSDDGLDASDYPKVQATGGLNKFMRVNNARENQQNGILSANVDVRWIGKKPVYFEYRFIFFDSRGRAINPDGPWTRGDAEPGTVDYLSANATRPDATDWRLDIRPRS